MRNSEAYFDTFDPVDPAIDDLRDLVRSVNKMLKKSGRGERYYVKLHARGHRQGVRRYRSELPLKFADRIDAYIYQRK
jgi:hypothetical protein